MQLLCPLLAVVLIGAGLLVFIDIARSGNNLSTADWLESIGLRDLVDFIERKADEERRRAALKRRKKFLQSHSGDLRERP